MVRLKKTDILKAEISVGGSVQLYCKTNIIPNNNSTILLAFPHMTPLNDCLSAGKKNKTKHKMLYF